MEGVPPEDLARHIEKKEREWGGNAQKKQRVADPDAIRAQFAAFQDSQSAPLPDGMGSANSNAFFPSRNANAAVSRNALPRHAADAGMPMPPFPGMLPMPGMPPFPPMPSAPPGPSAPALAPAGPLPPSRPASPNKPPVPSAPAVAGESAGPMPDKTDSPALPPPPVPAPPGVPASDYPPVPSIAPVAPPPLAMPVKSAPAVVQLPQDGTYSFAAPLDQGGGMLLIYSDTNCSMEEKRAMLPRYRYIETE
ncbi:hypothetical protein HDV03_001206 [Kappamyces sp. JEL0829]|nr:hypothetical protein HDV03_001206 [Kappamyces sp. JEL0829]